jgi:excisionase family DNA binding protein
MTDRLLLPVRDVARALGVSTWKVYELLDARALLEVRIGRRRMVPAVDLERYVLEHTVAAVNADQAAGDLAVVLEHGRPA